MRTVCLTALFCIWNCPVSYCDDDSLKKSIDYVEKQLGGEVEYVTSRKACAKFKNEILDADDLKAMAGLETDLVLLELKDGTITPNAIPHLKRFKKLEKVDICPDYYNDETLIAFKEINSVHLLGWAFFEDSLAIRHATHEDGVRYLYLGPYISDASVKAIAGLKNLRHLDITESKITDEGMKMISKIKSLQSLSFDFNHITKKSISQLGALERLVHISIVNTDANDDFIHELLNLKNLQRLDLAKTKISDNSIDYFLKLSQLEYLDLSNTAISAEGFARLGTLPKLSTVIIATEQISDELITVFDKHNWLHCLPICRSKFVLDRKTPSKNVRSLVLENLNISGKSLETLLKFPYLRKVYCQAKDMNDDWLKALVKTRKLACLTIKTENQPWIGDDGYVEKWNREPQNGLDTIEHFSIDGWKITGAGFAELKKLINLETLHIESMELDATALENLAKSPSLKRLYLKSVQIKAGDFYTLKKLTDLTTLDFHKVPLPQEAFDAIGQLPALDTLRIHDCEIAPTGIESLQKLASLKILCLFRTTFESATLKGLSKLQQIESLFIDDSNILNDDMQYIGSLTSLTELGLKGCPINHLGLKHFAKLEKLEHLHVDDEIITDDLLKTLHPLKTLFQALWAFYQDGKGLGDDRDSRRIWVSRYPVTDKSLRYFKDIPNLTKLDLTNEQASVEGLKELKSFEKLERLLITEMQLTDEKIAQLQTLPKLEALILSGGDYSDTDAKKLRKALGESVKLTFYQIVPQR